MKKISLITIFIIIFLLQGEMLAKADVVNYKGRILLQVEENGEAWYVNPDTSLRYYLGRPRDAFEIMKNQGIGITNNNLLKIPVGLEYLTGIDSDGDGLVDSLENAIDTNPEDKDTDKDGFSDEHELSRDFNPLGPGILPIDLHFAYLQKGKIFLQVEAHGEAWYVNPVNNHRYLLGRPIDAFNLMRNLGLGITNDDLNKISNASITVSEEDEEQQESTQVEKEIFELINKERTSRGLESLKWNNEIARVAREKSEDLVEENKQFTGFGWSCDYPVIHHEGLEFGLHNAERLNNRNFYSFSKTAENIALLSRASVLMSYNGNKSLNSILDECQTKRSSWDKEFKENINIAEIDQEKIIILKNEINRRTVEFDKEFKLNIEKVNWHTDDYIITESVKGWMESQGHKENILDSDYVETGIGAAYLEGYFIVTQIFIKRAECGYNSGPCCEKKGYYPYCFVPLSCTEKICGE